MSVTELIERLQSMPGHWPVHVERKSDCPCCGEGTDYYYTLDAVPSSFPSQGCMAVIVLNMEPS